MTTLTDRYVWAAARSVPDAQRPEFGRELRERIGDASDALIEQGRSPADAEHAALVELGDPAALAATYVDRPLQLIGPRYFLTWWRLLKLLYAIVLPIATAAVVLGQLIAEVPVGQLIGATVSAAIAIAVHLGFWTTLVFAAIERSPSSVPLATWTPEMLPQLPDSARSRRLGDLIASLVLLGLLAAAIVWQQFGLFVAERSVPVLDPALWSFWLPYFLGLIVLEALFAFVVYLRGWGWGLAAVNVLLNAAFVVPALWLFLTGQLFSPEFLELIEWPWGDAGRIVATIVAVVTVATAAWDMVDGFVKAARAKSAPAAA